MNYIHILLWSFTVHLQKVEVFPWLVKRLLALALDFEMTMSRLGEFILFCQVTCAHVATCGQSERWAARFDDVDDAFLICLLVL